MSPIKWFLLKQLPSSSQEEEKETQERERHEAAMDSCVCARPAQTEIIVNSSKQRTNVEHPSLHSWRECGNTKKEKDTQIVTEQDFFDRDYWAGFKQFEVLWAGAIGLLDD